jgi:outer membrane protein assembly factor BamA
VVAVDEGPQIWIESVAFSGNPSIPDDELLDGLYTQPRRFFGWLETGHLDEAELQIDLMRISSVYFDRGYVNVKVFPPKIAEVGDKLSIEIAIEEGDQYRLGRVSVVSDRGLPPLKSVQGEIFSRSRLGEDMETLRRHFGEGTVVTPITDIDNEKRIVHVTFEVSR